MLVINMLRKIFQTYIQGFTSPTFKHIVMINENGLIVKYQRHKKNPWFYFASELYRQSDRRMSAKLVPTFADKGRRVIRATDPDGRYSRLSRHGAATFPFK
jgi:hypothetical protein